MVKTKVVTKWEGRMKGAKVLRVVREERGWSQAELARRAQLNAATVSLIESGRLQPYAGQLAKLAAALGLPAAEARRLLEEVGVRGAV